MNTLGYQLLYGDQRADDAIAIFKLNTVEHPASSNAFDSLGEAYASRGEKDLAIHSYKVAIKLDPTNGHAAGELEKLKTGELRELKLERALWFLIPTVSAIGVLLVAAILVKRRRKRLRIAL
ncbi:MAG TPA: hypothetical protein VF749_00875 [Candidatus Acidoferrum sp.]